ncbi:unnamed protein product [Effrenium voratum]|nr:unnamed protein product [Effrenium voratum]
MGRRARAPCSPRCWGRCRSSAGARRWRAPWPTARNSPGSCMARCRTTSPLDAATARSGGPAVSFHEPPSRVSLASQALRRSSESGASTSRGGKRPGSRWRGQCTALRQHSAGRAFGGGVWLILFRSWQCMMGLDKKS